MTPTPVEVALLADQRCIEISWDDGVTTPLALDYLRGWCPCAACQGHFNLEKRFITGVSTTLLNVEPVGTYGMKLTWADGHGSGIYAFDYLRAIAVAPPGDSPSNESFLNRTTH